MGPPGPIGPPGPFESLESSGSLVFLRSSIPPGHLRSPRSSIPVGPPGPPGPSGPLWFPGSLGSLFSPGFPVSVGFLGLPGSLSFLGSSGPPKKKRGPLILFVSLRSLGSLGIPAVLFSSKYVGSLALSGISSDNRGFF